MSKPAFLGNVAVLGTGVTGTAVVKVLSELGAHTTAYNTDPTADVARLPGDVVVAHTEDVLAHLKDQSFDLIVTSPGISPLGDFYRGAADYARQRGIQLWGEMELAWQLGQHLGKQPDWFTVTGTNGKTTTVGLVGAMLEADGRKCAVVGNVGRSIVEVIAHQEVDALAVEMSSFQLHDTFSVSPVASVCLNIDTDHLDWHGTADNYAADKARVYANTQVACAYDAADRAVITMVENADVVEGARAIGYRPDVPQPGEVGIVEEYLVDRTFGDNYREEAIAVATLEDVSSFAGPMPSLAVISDVLAAIVLVRAGGVAPEAVRAGLRAFRPAAHRREVIGQVADMTWIDDSKATNAHAARASLRGFGQRSVIWIAGGDTKGQDLTALVRDIEPVLRGVVVIGADPTPVVTALQTHAPQVPHVVVDGHEDFMFSVVNEAVALSRPGDHVVLAPACASWDQFENYAQRGQQFREAVARLEQAWAQASNLGSKPEEQSENEVP